MVSSEDCVFCPEGQYCQDGEIKGACAAGYFCDFGAESATDMNKICPKGHYCPAGTELPIRCPDGFYFPDTGATSRLDCRQCEAGYYCIENDGVSRTCPAGHYCTDVTTEPSACRQGFYQPNKGEKHISACKPCPVGFFCDKIAVVDYLKFPCPKGHYCTDEGQTFPPKMCPPGTYQPYEQMISEEACLPCPEGHKCREGADYPEPCDAGYICPAGSSKQFACSIGTYCPAMSSNETVCPEAFMCQGYRTDIYTKCKNGTYCPEGSERSQTCPAGYFGSSNTTNIDLNSACFACGLGQYSNA